MWEYFYWTGGTKNEKYQKMAHMLFICFVLNNFVSGMWIKVVI